MCRIPVCSLTLRFRTVLLLLFLADCWRISAGDAATVPNYVTRVWLRENGLPQNAVTSVVQTRDGYIWVGTYNGLARFDGARFISFDNINTPGMSSSRVTALYEAPDGALWIGHERGELTRYAGGKFQ